MRILHVVAGRRGFLKIAPVLHALEQTGGAEQALVHAGPQVNGGDLDALLAELEIQPPDVNLGVSSGSSAVRTARALIALEPVVARVAPDWILTVGDVDSTLAAALVAAKLRVPLGHVEAGLRAGDPSGPEEVNRVLTDRVSQALFTSEPSADANLIREGITPEKIHDVGSVMIDTLERFRETAARLRVPETMGLPRHGYVLVAVDAPANVEDPTRLSSVLEALGQVAAECGLAVLYPMNADTASSIRRHGLETLLASLSAMQALRYPEFLCLLQHAGAVITDAGSVQEETTVLGVPCLTLRSSTDRPLTISQGTNRLFDGDLNDLADVVREAMKSENREHRPALWDGHSAERIARAVLEAPIGAGVSHGLDGRGKP